MVEIFVKPEWVSPVAITLVGIIVFLVSSGIVLEILKITRWTLQSL